MRTITSSSDAGRRNLNEALVSFIETMDDGRFSTSDIDPADYPDVLPTTWTRLTKRGLLKVGGMNGEQYELMPLGFLTALRISMRLGRPSIS
jgi:hypothetical protein